MTRARTLVGLVTALAAGGCGGMKHASEPATQDFGQIEHGGRTRTYLLRMPAGAGADARVPLLLVLHGGGGNALNAEAMTGFTNLARTERFIVAYPEGTARRGRLLTWNAGHCCGYAMQEGVDDVGFLRALIDDLVRRHPIDTDRVFMTGMSNGAMMSHRAGIELGDRIAAIAPVAGGLFGDESVPRQGVSAIIVNGLLDRSVPYGGGAPGGLFAGSWDGTPVRPAVEQSSFWARVNGCTAMDSTAATGYIHLRFTCRRPLGVEFYGVTDGGHAWPGGRAGSRLGDRPSQSLDASSVIWTFFSNHPKR